MDVEATVRVPQLIYDIYAEAARALENCTAEQVMADTLIAYTQLLFEDMAAKGELQADG